MFLGLVVGVFIKLPVNYTHRNMAYRVPNGVRVRIKSNMNSPMLTPRPPERDSAHGFPPAFVGRQD